MQQIGASRDLKSNKEANNVYMAATEASELDETDNEAIDAYIESELAKSGVTEQIPDQLDPMGNVISYKESAPYIAFAKEKKKVEAILKSQGLLEKTDKKEIEKLAAERYKKERASKIKEDKFTRYLEDADNLSEKAKSIIGNYTQKTGDFKGLEYVKAHEASRDLAQIQTGLVDQINNIDTKIKPKGYKFTSQSEVDAQNKLIEERNELTRYYKNNIGIGESLGKTMDSTSKEIEDLALAQDMLKRDYSTVGSITRQGYRLGNWANDILSMQGYIGDIVLNGITSPMSAQLGAVSEDINNSILGNLINVSPTGQITNKLSTMFIQEHKLIQKFKIGGVEFGFIPSLEDISFGEYTDLDTYIVDWNDYHKAMAVLYRPIKKNGLNGTYEIEEYNGSITYSDVMKHAPLDACLGATVFFYSLGNELLKATIAYLENNQEVQNILQLRTLEKDGAGTVQSMLLLKETLQDLTMLQNYQLTSV